MLLRVESVGKRYDHADGPVHALADVSLSVTEGAFVTVTGPSGSGKTTLLLATCRSTSSATRRSRATAASTSAS